MAHHHEVWIDTTKNRFYTRARGFFTPDDVEETAEALLKELEKVKPGFDVISDVSELGVSPPEGVKEMHRILDIYVQKNIGRIVFVMGESLARMQFVRAARDLNLEIEYAASIEEAERMLDKPQ